VRVVDDASPLASSQAAAVSAFREFRFPPEIIVFAVRWDVDRPSAVAEVPFSAVATATPHAVGLVVGREVVRFVRLAFPARTCPAVRCDVRRDHGPRVRGPSAAVLGADFLRMFGTP
jgi:hypothetical protein